MYKHFSSFAVSATLLGGLAGTSGCVFDEQLIEYNMQGTIVVPREAATRTFLSPDALANCYATEDGDEDGEANECVDVRNIGAVYVGVFPSVFGANVVATYPHPEVGPGLEAGSLGDTYPYGGTSVGDFRFPCFDDLQCKLVSGRYQDYEQIISWFNETLEIPITDAEARPVESGEYFRQTCMDLLEVTSDEEINLLPKDADSSGAVEMTELDFVENADGDFESTFVLYAQEFFWDQEQEEAEGCIPGTDCTGFSVWAYVDQPSSLGVYNSCIDGTQGYEVEEYNYDFFGGRVASNILNDPSTYVSVGDWVSDSHKSGSEWVPEAYVWKDIYDQPVIRLGYEVK